MKDARHVRTLLAEVIDECGRHPDFKANSKYFLEFNELGLAFDGVFMFVETNNELRLSLGDRYEKLREYFWDTMSSKFRDRYRKRE